MIEKTPLVSVVMTTYNHEKYITEAIQSILEQTFTDFELIIINDGSTDGTENKIISFTDKRIIYIYQDNQGPSTAANNGILKAQGKYIALMSGDDVCYPQRLEKQYEYLKTTDSKIVFSWVDFINDNSQFIEGEHFAKLYFNHPNRNSAEIIKYLFMKGNYFCAVTAFLEKEILLSTGLFNVSLIQLQDFEMWIKIVKKYDIFILSEKLVKYRIRNEENNLSHPVNIVRSIFEGYQVYKTILDGIPINIFKKAFAEEIINSNFKQGIEYKLEKAFLYLKHSSDLIRSISAEKMYNILQNHAVLSVAKEKYNFGLPELYKLTQEMDITNTKPLQYTQSQLELSRSQLQHTQSQLESQLELSQSQLQHTQSQLQHTQSQLESQLELSQSQLQHTQSKLQDTQSQLELSQSQLQDTQSQLEWQLKLSQSQLQHTQSQLELSQSQLQDTQSRLKFFQSQLQDTQSQLQHTQAESEQVRSQLKHIQSELVASQEKITAMETSKFWRLREFWFGFKQSIKLKGD